VVICSGALLFSNTVLRPSLVTLCSHKSGRCAVKLYHVPHLWYTPFYTLPCFRFQCSPTLNRQLALRRKAATNKLVYKIVKHNSWPIQLDILNPTFLRLTSRKRCGWTCNQLTSKVDGGITGSRLRWLIPTYCATPQSGNRVLTSLDNSGLY